MNAITRSVITVTPDMVGAHEWHQIDYWKYPLWKCQRCKMQTKNLAAAEARECLPTKKGMCRVCHEQATTKTSLYCRQHALESGRSRRKSRALTDAQIIEMSRDNTPLRVIAERLGVSVTTARGLIRRIKFDAYWDTLLRLERELGPCACGDLDLYIKGRGFLDDGPVICRGCLVIRRESSLLETR